MTWTRKPVDGSMTTHPGVYCLRSNETDWSEEKLWRTYTTLTDLEAVFRSLKSELGLRPLYHRKPVRAEGHLFITVIAYQLVQVIRRRLAERGSRGCRSAAGSRCVVRSPGASASPRRSSAPMAGPCMCARRRTRSRGSGRSSMRSASNRRPVARRRWSSEGGKNRFYRVCSAIRGFCQRNPLIQKNLSKSLVNLANWIPRPGKGEEYAWNNTKSIPCAT